MPLDFIRPDAVIASLRAHSKKQVLQELSERAALLSDLDERDIVDAVTRRERLGSTGVGNGIAIPHGKMKALTGMVGVFGRAGRPIEFEALDDEPVDLFFLLLAPEDSGADHLKALSRVARLLRNPDMVADLRAAHDAPTIHRLLSQGGAL